jgi:DNA-binding transcriptional MerR regulator
MNLPELNKRYYSIGEVAKMFEVRTSVLRFWEKEFKELKPRRTQQKRLYTQDDIKLIYRIHTLLKEKSYTIEGAKKALKENNTKKREEITKRLEKVRDRLEKLKQNLD